jgi:hypothetical protein
VPEPILDTWRLVEAAGYWLVQPRLAATAQEQAERSLAALAALARPWRTTPHGVDIQVDLELLVWHRRSDGLVRDWLRVPTELYATAETVELAVGHTIFAPGIFAPTPNDLHALNQPLLGEVLRAWEAAVGPIVDCDGRDGLYRYGYTV